MKQLELLSPDGSPVPSSNIGSVPPGSTTTSRAMILKNTGTEAITSVRARVEQASVADGEYHVTVGSLALTGANQEVLSAPLAAGNSVSVTEYASTPAGLSSTGPDSGDLIFEYDS